MRSPCLRSAEVGLAARRGADDTVSGGYQWV